MRRSDWKTRLSLLFLTLSGCVALDGDALDARAERSAQVSGGDACARPAALGALAGLCESPLVSELREVSARAGAGARAFTFRVTQPIDHQDPARGTFSLRVQLLHRGESAPTVLSHPGYHLFAPTPSDSELSYLLRANAVTLEHRFFGPSTPERDAGGQPPLATWKYLTIAQSAADAHRVVELLRPIYPRGWVSTGASKGGMTAVYHRRFYPDDVDGTVAYVAPHSDSADDPRYVSFLHQVGTAACRDKVRAFQRAVLSRRGEVLPLLTQAVRGRSLTFERVGSLDAALEHAVQEYHFAFWQYGTAASCGAIPAPSASAQALYAALSRTVPATLSSDRNLTSVDGFAAYYYQAATQLGQYGPLEEGIADLLQHAGTYTVGRYAPQVPDLRYDEAPMRDVQRWLLDEGDRFIFVYGENDPWTATAFATPSGRDVRTYVVPGGNHGASLHDTRLPAAARAEARATLARWTGTTIAPQVAPPPGPLPYVHLPPHPEP